MRSTPWVWASMVSLAAVMLLVGCGGSDYPQGERLYAGFCANCHMDDGSGLEGLIPPLAQADWVRDKQEQLPCVIRYGLRDTILVNGISYTQPMDGIDALSDIEITNIINYVNHAWGNDYGAISLQEVQDALDACPR